LEQGQSAKVKECDAHFNVKKSELKNNFIVIKKQIKWSTLLNFFIEQTHVQGRF
jgi:hypothetical protein